MISPWKPLISTCLICWLPKDTSKLRLRAFTNNTTCWPESFCLREEVCRSTCTQPWVSTLRAKACLSTLARGPSGSTCLGSDGSVGKTGCATRGGLFPHDRRLSWALRMGMVQKWLSHRSNLFQRRRTLDLQALLGVAFMLSFDRAIALWRLWRAHVRLNAQTEQEAAQGRGEIAP